VSTRFTSKDLVAIRAQAREVGELAGLETLQQTRFATAVSEITRNAVQYAGEGTITFSVMREQDAHGAMLVAQVTDRGPGIADIDAVLSGMGTSASGRAPMGILGSKRLVDRLTMESPATGGTSVQLEMSLPRNAPHLDAEDMARFASRSAMHKARSPHEELDKQNRELLRALQELREKQTALEKADEMKNHFITTLAHELRSPLSTLDMSLELMRRRPDASADERATRREVMARQTGQMTKLVDDLMDVARVRQGKVQLNKVPVEVNTLVTQSVEMTGAAIAAKAHNVSVDLHGAPLWVSGDAPRLTQVLCNLIQNSARYTAPGGAIRVKVRPQDTCAVIEVEDNGIGISPEMLPQIFGMFVQGHGGGETSEGGLGLGLTLVHHLVNDHGGAVSAASEGLDQGSRFVVRLPLTQAPASAPH
jgi:signal transduction histidine kinase